MSPDGSVTAVREPAHERPLVLVTGVGPGTGAAVVRRFAGAGHPVAMLSRSERRLTALATEIPGSRGYACDVSKKDELESVLARVTQEMGHPSVVVHNAVSGSFGNFQEIEPSDLERAFAVNAGALLQLARSLSPAMVSAGHGAIVVTGNTSTWRGKANFSAFAPTKAAQRVLAESLARHLGPKGVHVAYVVIDGVIDVPWTRKLRPTAPDNFFVKPSAIADEIFHVVHQDRSAWSFNVELRPFGEEW